MGSLELRIVTPETCTDREVALLSEMQGIHSFLLHYRKPLLALNELVEKLDLFPPELRKMVIVHAEEWHPHFEGLAGWHLPKKRRLNLTTAHLDDYSEYCRHHQLISSTGAHSMDELQELGRFESVLCSPVFNSISKSGYLTKETWLITKEYTSRSVGLGGVEPLRFKHLKETGFSNAALLGYIWNDPDPLKQWKNCLAMLND